jgi:CDP-diacylglycerol pyrophosphatase
LRRRPGSAALAASEAEGGGHGALGGAGGGGRAPSAGARRAAPRSRTALGAAAAAALAAALALSAAPGGARTADPHALWEIVHDHCVPNLRRRGDPAPCAAVDLRDGVARGYAILKDRSGPTQFLLIPTARVGGIEDPALLAPGAPNLFAAAWRARSFVETRAGRALPREDVALAVNSVSARSQDQLHIHIGCIRAGVRDALRAGAPRIGARWAPLDPPLAAGRRYLAMRVLGEDLGPANPVVLLADGVPGAREAMGRYTLVVAGATFAEGGPGFVLLADRADPAAGDRGWGEGLLDHACALATAGGTAAGQPPR